MSNSGIDNVHSVPVYLVTGQPYKGIMYVFGAKVKHFEHSKFRAEVV